MRLYRQCRLRREHITYTGFEQLVTYLPMQGTNGVEVIAGRVVSLPEDPDSRPWLIEHASEQLVDEIFIRRKRSEGRDRLATVS